MHIPSIPIVAGLLALLPAVDLRAQATPAPVADASVRMPVVAATGDAILTAWVTTANDNAIALAQIAKQRAQSAQVREFAQKLIDDHTAFSAQLQTLTAKSPTPVVEANGDRAAAGQPFDHAGLVRELGKRCLATATRQLSEKNGVAFDHAYLQMAMVAHSQAADSLDVFGSYASAPLRPLLQSGRKTMMAHLVDATALCTEMDHTKKADGNSDGK